MINHKHEQQEPPTGDADAALERRLSDLGPLIRQKELAEAAPPDDAFVWELWARLVGGDGSMSKDLQSPTGKEPID